MEALYVVANPEFNKADFTWLSEVRKSRAGNWGPPQFTLVFPGAELDAAAFAAFVRARVGDIRRIAFRLRSALVVPEATFGKFHVFLVPDEGFGTIIRLHERLHTGPLERCLRPDMPYLPHLTVATTSDYDMARKIASDMNKTDISISGTIEKLRIERREGDVVRLHSEIALAKAGWLR